jgi:excisionase family DNA binding protein
MTQIMTLQEVSDYLRVHPSTIYRILKHKGLPAFKIGTDWRFVAGDIENWIAKTTIKTDE